eukprot:GGOE01004780.1.p1 GENE.GGOE01004780.1~~GGOE01004780.1.p1  ORF type:complete len:721 (+),score=171.63 GGOE01004780.1:29-2191(+)
MCLSEARDSISLNIPMACNEFESLVTSSRPTTIADKSNTAGPKRPHQGFEPHLSGSSLVPAFTHASAFPMAQGSQGWVRGIPVLWTICLLVLAIAAVSALPIMGISIVQTESLGDTLLLEATEQQFNVMHVSIQAALDEGDYWGDFIAGWLRHRPPPLLARDLTPTMKVLMLTWLSTVAKRVGGFCSAFVSEMSPTGGWQFCATRIFCNTTTEYHWEYMPNSTTMYEVHTDQYFNLLDTVASWSAYNEKQQFSWPDGHLEWDQPSIWVGCGKVITEVGQHRMVKVGNASIVNRFWMEDADWAQVLQANLNTSHPINTHSSPIAFLLSNTGHLIASTCGATNCHGTLILANESDCYLLRQTYEALDRGGYLLPGAEAAFHRADLPAGTYLVGLRQIRTTRSGDTPYYLATAYPYCAVNRPVRWTILLFGVTSMCSVCLTIVMASVLTGWLLDKPLRHVARDLDRCVELDISTPFSHSRTPIWELRSILDSLAKVRGTLQAVTKFVPVPVVRQSLKLGENITMSMTPTEASVLFLDIQNFTSLTESTETRHLVTSVAAFFERLSDVIVSHNGVIDKYIGDCIMAFWNTPLHDYGHQLHACQAALACLLAMEEQPPDLLPLKGRIGLEAGPVYAGLFGSKHRMNYTVVGDVVNVASRLESLNKQHNTRILLGPIIYIAVAEQVITRQLPPTDIRGKAERLVLYELLGLLHPDHMAPPSPSLHS